MCIYIVANGGWLAGGVHLWLVVSLGIPDRAVLQLQYTRKETFYQTGQNAIRAQNKGIVEQILILPYLTLARWLRLLPDHHNGGQWVSGSHVVAGRLHLGHPSIKRGQWVSGSHVVASRLHLRHHSLVPWSRVSKLSPRILI